MWSSTTYTYPKVSLVALGNTMVSPQAVEAVDTDRNSHGKMRLHLARGTVLIVAATLEETLAALKDADLTPVGEGAVRFSAIEAIVPGLNSTREAKLQLTGATTLEVSMSVAQVSQALKAGLEARKPA